MLHAITRGNKQMKYMSIIAIAALSGSAMAGIISETESNNTLGTANDIGTFAAPGGSIAIDGVLGANDVDWYSFTLSEDASLTFIAAFGPSTGDGMMQIVAAGGDVIAFDDDSGVGLMPAIQLEDLSAGIYYIGFSGYEDVDATSVDTDELADGQGHSENFAYKLNVGFTIVPAPGALALAGMGGLVAARRKR